MSRLTLIARIEDKVLRFWQGKPSRGGQAWEAESIA